MKSNIFSNKIMTVLLAAIVSILWGTLFPMIKIGYRVFAAILGFLYVIIINLEGMNLVFRIGEILIILASFSSMFGQMASKNIYDKYDPKYIVAYSQLLGGIILVISGLAFGGSIGTISLESIAVLGYICIASITANILWNTLIKYNNMSKLAVLKSMDPLFASLFSAILLGENVFNTTFLVATLLIITAIYVSNKSPKKT